MTIDIVQFVNQHFNSNTFILSQKGRMNVWIVDPGDTQPLFDWMECNGIENVKGVLLTHGHFDHIYGINKILNRFPQTHFYVINDYGKSVLYDPKKNNSYYTELGSIILESEDCVIQYPSKLELWPDTPMRVLDTPGHTDDSVCLLVDAALFTGDTLIKDTRTVTKLKTGNVEKLNDSIQKLQELQGNGYIVYPGHGDKFELDGYDLKKMLKL